MFRNLLARIVAFFRKEPESAPLTPIQQWVTALRSGKYKQGTGQLKNYDGAMCCLGVACDISGLGSWRGETYVVSPYDLSRTNLPQAVIDYFSVDSANPTLLTSPEGNDLTAISANDVRHMSFNEIADLLEQRYTQVAV
jgi:hypothetical protein